MRAVSFSIFKNARALAKLMKSTTIRLFAYNYVSLNNRDLKNLAIKLIIGKSSSNTCPYY